MFRVLWLYRLLYIPFLICSCPYYLYRMLRRGGYAKDFGHRFGAYSDKPSSSPGKKRIWIQAVSVGELRAIEGLIGKLRESGDYWIAVTTTTSTAYAILQKDLKGITDFRAYFPLDFLPVTKKVWNQIKPDIAVLMESELWPEHMHQAKKRSVPLMLINARLSDRSFKRYQKFGPLTVFMRQNLGSVLACSQIDADRYIKLGVPKSRIQVTGSLKLDKKIEPRLSDSDIKKLKAEMGFSEDSRVILGSSTWPGEELMLGRIYKLLLQEFADIKMLIVPRHAERKSELASELKASGLVYHFRSDKKQAPEGTELYIADTTGELPTLSQVAEVAFIGKSMPPHKEAQSMIECAVLGIPALIGPGYSNFRAIVESLKQQSLIKVIESENELQESLAHRLRAIDSLEAFKKEAKKWHQSNLGSLKKTIQTIEKIG